MTMLEHLARVLIVRMDTFQCGFDQKLPNAPATAPWKNYSAAEQSAARLAARAVVEAMRPLTPEMTAAAWREITKDKKRAGIVRLGPGAGFGEWWNAALDSILSEQEAGR